MKLYELCNILDDRQRLKIQLQFDDAITDCISTTIPDELRKEEVLIIAPKGSYLLVGLRGKKG